MEKKTEKPKKVLNKVGGGTQLVKQAFVENKRLIAIVVFASAIIMLFIAEGAKQLEKLHPYAINVDGAPICYLESEENAKAAIMDVVNDYVVSGATLTAVDTEERLTIEKSDDKDKRSEIVNVTTAANELRKLTNSKDKDRLEMHVACTKNRIVSYTPEPIYKKDKTMLAGDAKTIKKGRKGTQVMATVYTCVNDKIIAKEKNSVKILDKGKRATVKKGTLGLPDGEDWRTFTGDPIFKNGKELITTAKKYMGAPYRYGGSSLTKGIDCVWFVKRMYEKYGINIPTSHSKIHKLGKGVSLANAKKGDIICYSKHVGLYVGDGKMIEATSVAGVRISKVNKKRLVTVRRVVK